MRKYSKRLKTARTSIEAGKVYSLEEALELVKTLGVTKFDAGVEVHIRLGTDPKKTDQSVRGTTVLPHGTGKTRRVIAFVGPQNEKEAKDAGADIIADENAIQMIKTTQKVDADIAVATPDMMRKLAPIAKILGQKGMMPNPKTETVTPHIAKTIKDLKSGGKISFRSDDTGNIHQLIGRVSFSTDKLKENYEAFLEIVRKVKPETVKGTFIKGITLCSSMGPGIKIAASK